MLARLAALVALGAVVVAAYSGDQHLASDDEWGQLYDDHQGQRQMHDGHGYYPPHADSSEHEYEQTSA